MEQFLEASDLGGAIFGTSDYVQAGGRPKPAGWHAPTQQGFDWTGNGSANGKLVVDKANRTVSVDWGGGRIAVTGIRADIDIGGEYADTTPAAVADITGDGRLDLIVMEDDTAAVITGQGSQTPTRSIAFGDIGKLPTEWLSPPRSVLVNRFGSRNQVPRGKLARTIVPLWDINGDGINDFALELPKLGRANGSWLYYGGQPCQAT